MPNPSLKLSLSCLNHQQRNKNMRPLNQKYISHYYLYLVNFRLVWYIKYAIQEEKISFLVPTGTLGDIILEMCVSVSVHLLLYWFLHRLEHSRGFSKVIKAWEGLFINIFQLPSVVCPTQVLKIMNLNDDILFPAMVVS